jgi:hypothetical protein
VSLDDLLQKLEDESEKEGMSLEEQCSALPDGVVDCWMEEVANTLKDDTEHQALEPDSQHLCLRCNPACCFGDPCQFRAGVINRARLFVKLVGPFARCSLSSQDPTDDEDEDGDTESLERKAKDHALSLIRQQQLDEEKNSMAAAAAAEDTDIGDTDLQELNELFNGICDGDGHAGEAAGRPSHKENSRMEVVESDDEEGAEEEAADMEEGAEEEADDEEEEEAAPLASTGTITPIAAATQAVAEAAAAEVAAAPEVVSAPTKSALKAAVKAVTFAAAPAAVAEPASLTVGMQALADATGAAAAVTLQVHVVGP